VAAPLDVISQLSAHSGLQQYQHLIQHFEHRTFAVFRRNRTQEYPHRLGYPAFASDDFSYVGISNFQFEDDLPFFLFIDERNGIGIIDKLLGNVFDEVPHVHLLKLFEKLPPAADQP
jgi:hypothetical protein